MSTDDEHEIPSEQWAGADRGVVTICKVGIGWVYNSRIGSAKSDRGWRPTRKGARRAAIADLAKWHGINPATFQRSTTPEE